MFVCIFIIYSFIILFVLPSCLLAVRAVETEKNRADRFECMLEDSRKERDAECERLQQNIDSQKEQLDVSKQKRWDVICYQNVYLGVSIPMEQLDVSKKGRGDVRVL